VPKASVIVVNYNGRALLGECLEGLRQQTFTDFEALLVDNGSSDGSVQWVRDHYPEVHILAQHSNLGFAAANNAGFQATDSPLLITLNNDARPTPDWLSLLVEAARAGERTGMVASRMIFADRPGMINSTGICLDPVGIAWDRLGGAPVEAGDAAAEIFGPCAGAALYTRELLLDVADGGQAFDEDFFIYMEDVDLAWRAQLRGWRCVYVPQALVYHHHSRTLGEGSPFKNRLLARNKVWMVIKNYPTAGLLRYWPLIVLYDVLSVPYRLMVHGQASALRGRLEALRHLGPALRKRRVIQARRTTGWRQLRRQMAPLEPPWALLRRYSHLHPAPAAET
jgi:hypothetical protein